MRPRVPQRRSLPYANFSVHSQFNPVELAVIQTEVESMNNSRFKRLNPVELAVIQPDLLRVPSILRHELFSNDIELVVRKEDATSNRRLGSLNFNLSSSISFTCPFKLNNKFLSFEKNPKHYLTREIFKIYEKT